MQHESRSEYEIVRDPSDELMLEAADWLALRRHETLGSEIMLRSRAVRHIAHAVIARADGVVAGVSVVSQTGGWYLEALSQLAAAALVDALPSEIRPRRLTTAAGTRAWVIGMIESRWRLTRHHRLLAMTCARAEGGEGRWAASEDLATLRIYQDAYNSERRTANATNWTDAVATRQVAVLDHDGRVASVVKRSGETARYACIGGTFTFPEFRGRSFGRKVTAYMVEQLLVDRPRVHLLVDDDNVTAIRLYRSLDFGEIGECHADYLAS